MEGITTILFDVDGTILDTREFIIKATEYALLKLGYKVPEYSIIASNIGKAFPDFYFSLTGSNKDTEKLIEIHRAFQFDNYHLSKPFPNAIETLKKLKKKGYKFAAVTTRSNKTSHQTLLNADIFDLFDVIISNEDTKELKPSPAPLLMALKHMKEIPERAVMIGDSHLDIEAGENARAKTIRAAYGFHKDNLHNPEPDFIIDDIKELLKIL